MNKQKGIASLSWIVIILSVVIVAGGITTWQMWPKTLPTPLPAVDPTSTTTPTPSANETAVKEVVTGFLEAKQSRNFENAKPFLTPEFAQTINQTEFTGTSNPHLGDFSISNLQLLPDGETYEVRARVYSEYTGEGVIGYQDNNYYLQPFDSSYRINRIEPGEYINLDETADWKTYTNEEYSFEIKHPDYWNFYERSPIKGEIIAFAKNKSDADAGLGLKIRSRINTEKLWIKDWWYNNEYPTIGEPDTMHNGVIETTSCGDGGCVLSIFWGNEDYIYESNMPFDSHLDSTSLFKKMSFYCQILSTFKFID